MNILIMMAGTSEVFYKSGFKYPKLLTEIKGKTMVELVIEGLKSIISPNNNIIFIINQKDNDRYYLGDVIKLLVPYSNVLISHDGTAGALPSSLLAVDYLDLNDSLVMTNGDQILDYKESDIVDSFLAANADAGVVVFNSVHPQWSYVQIDNNNLVSEVAEKKPISNNATTGFYFYKKTLDYIRCAKKTILKGDSIDGIYYTCPVFNEMILEHKKVIPYHIESSLYNSLTTPEKVKKFENK